MRSKLLIIIIVIASFLRFTDLGVNPPSLNWDEISIGYDAYSILKTGKDQFNTFLPLVFRSLDDDKLPFYTYATALSIVIFGKNEFAIRFPSAIFGVLTVLVMYFFTKEILSKEGQSDLSWNERKKNIAIIASLILAITPWHIHFSRVGFEGNVAVFLNMLGGLFYLKWLHESNNRKSLRYCIISAISFVLSLYTYQSSRAVVPLILLGWSILTYKEVLKKYKEALIGIVVAGILLSPIIIQLFSGEGLTRFRATSIFYSKNELVLENNREGKEDFDKGKGNVGVVVHSLRVAWVRQITNNYLSHFNYSFLFSKADLVRHQIPGFGLLQFWQLPLIIIGIAFIIRMRENLYPNYAIWWLIISPIPAALTWQVPHSIRVENLLPILCIASATGIWIIMKKIQKWDLHNYTSILNKESGKNILFYIAWAAPKISYLSIMIILTTSMIHIWLNYKTLLPTENAREWLYGRKEMVKIVEAEKDKYDQVIVDLSVDWAYLWFLWYGNYEPATYLKNGGTVSGGFDETQNKLGNIKFKKFPFSSIEFGSQKVAPNSLYIGLPEQFPKELIPYKRIDDPGGNPAIFIVKT